MYYYLLPVVIIGAPLLVAIIDLMGTKKGTTSFGRGTLSRLDYSAPFSPA